GDQGELFGANLALPLRVGAETRAIHFTSSSLVLEQSNSLSARSLGLGSRRLLALGIQAAAGEDGSVMLTDEIEYGLEPHRLRHLLSTLIAKEPHLQAILTSHSTVAITELGAT